MAAIMAWTDYPFVAAGDIGGKLAPIRHVEVIQYDGDMSHILRQVPRHTYKVLGAGND